MWFDCLIEIRSVRGKSKIHVGVTLRLQASNGYPTVTQFILGCRERSIADAAMEDAPSAPYLSTRPPSVDQVWESSRRKRPSNLPQWDTADEEMAPELPPVDAAPVMARAAIALAAAADELDLDAALDGADLVVTGEGFLEEQSFDGKVVGGVLERAADACVPVLAIAGEVFDDADKRLHAVSLVERFGEERSRADTVSCVEAVVAEALAVLQAKRARGG